MRANLYIGAVLILYLTIIISGAYINGEILVVDGGDWLAKPRRMSKEHLREIGRAIETRSRMAQPGRGTPKSKL